MKPSDAGLELVIGRMLRAGVTAASVLLAAGLALSGISPGAASWIMQAGLLILIATPPARVVLSIVEYGSARDWRFALLSSIVLVELLAGAVVALVFHQRL